MALGRPKIAQILTDGERVQLNSLAHRSRTAPHLARRARIILGCGEGINNKVLAKRLRMKWRQRGRERGVHGPLVMDDMDITIRAAMDGIGHFRSRTTSRRMS